MQIGSSTNQITWRRSEIFVVVERKRRKAFTLSISLSSSFVSPTWNPHESWTKKSDLASDVRGWSISCLPWLHSSVIVCDRESVDQPNCLAFAILPLQFQTFCWSESICQLLRSRKQEFEACLYAGSCRSSCPRTQKFHRLWLDSFASSTQHESPNSNYWHRSLENSHKA